MTIVLSDESTLARFRVSKGAIEEDVCRLEAALSPFESYHLVDEQRSILTDAFSGSAYFSLSY